MMRPSRERHCDERIMSWPFGHLMRRGKECQRMRLPRHMVTRAHKFRSRAEPLTLLGLLVNAEVFARTLKRDFAGE